MGIWDLSVSNEAPGGSFCKASTGNSRGFEHAQSADYSEEITPSETLDKLFFFSIFKKLKVFRSLKSSGCAAVTKSKLNEELIFKAEQIPQDGLSGRIVLEASWFSLPSEADDPIRSIKLTEPISVEFHLERVGRDVRLKLSLATTAALTCARCLKVFSFPLRTQSRLTLCEANHSSPLEREMELTLEHLESGTFEAGEIDLSDLIYDQIVLSFPIKPLCREDCKGLCPRCGADQDLERCGCVTATSDPRWEALRKIRTPSNPHGRRTL